MAQKMPINILIVENSNNWSGLWIYSIQSGKVVIITTLLLNYISNSFAIMKYRYVRIFSMIQSNHLIYLNAKHLLIRLRIKYRYKQYPLVDIISDGRGGYLLDLPPLPHQIIRILLGSDKLRAIKVWRILRRSVWCSVVRRRVILSISIKAYLKLHKPFSGLYLRKRRKFIRRKHPRTRLFGDKYLCKIC